MIVGTFQGGFGDIWGATSLMLHLSELRGRPTFYSGDDPRLLAIARCLESRGSIAVTLGRIDLLIVYPGRLPLFTKAKGYTPHRTVDWKTPFSRRYLPTREQWRGGGGRSIVYQLVPRNEGFKSCGPNDIELFEGVCRELGYVPTPIGAHLGIIGCLRRACDADFFVGLDSGMAHLCHSVGLPVHLIQNNSTDRMMMIAHGAHPSPVHRNVAEFLEWLRTDRDHASSRLRRTVPLSSHTTPCQAPPDDRSVTFLQD